MSVKINGFCDERFLPLRDAFVGHFEDGIEIGSSIALTLRGKTVVDLWAGYSDPEQTRPWEKDTIVPVMSTTKIMAAISTLMLIDRGSIDLDETVAQYWPEFAQGGKENVTVRDALTHRAGVPGLAEPAHWDLMRDWSAITARIAAEPHWFDGRRQICYHAGTFGFPIGEIIRRVDGRMPSVFFREEIAQRAGADFWIRRSPETETARVAQVRVSPHAYPSEGVGARVMKSVVLPDLNSWEFQSAEVPAMSGLGNGRSIARACAIIANGGTLDGVRYLSQDMVAEAGKEQAYGQCPLMGWARMGLGFGLDSKEFPAPSPTSMHWGGYGGSWGFMDPAAQLSVGYAPNNFLGSSRVDPRLDRFRAVVKELLHTL